MAATAVARTRTFRLHCMAANLLNEGWERSHGDSAVPGRVSRSLCGHARPHIAELRRDRPRRPGAAEIFHALQDGAGPGASRGWVRAAAMPAPMQAVQMGEGEDGEAFHAADTTSTTSSPPPTNATSTSA